ncbi:MAG: hypothetical protein QXF87_05635 [Thermofilaceae archaeon]
MSEAAPYGITLRRVKPGDLILPEDQNNLVSFWLKVVEHFKHMEEDLNAIDPSLAPELVSRRKYLETIVRSMPKVKTGDCVYASHHNLHVEAFRLLPQVYDYLVDKVLAPHPTLRKKKENYKTMVDKLEERKSGELVTSTDRNMLVDLAEVVADCNREIDEELEACKPHWLYIVSHQETHVIWTTDTTHYSIPRYGECYTLFVNPSVRNPMYFYVSGNPPGYRYIAKCTSRQVGMLKAWTIREAPLLKERKDWRELWEVGERGDFFYYEAPAQYLVETLVYDEENNVWYKVGPARITFSPIAYYSTPFFRSICEDGIPAVLSIPPRRVEAVDWENNVRWTCDVSDLTPPEMPNYTAVTDTCDIDDDGVEEALVVMTTRWDIPEPFPPQVIYIALIKEGELIAGYKGHWARGLPDDPNTVAYIGWDTLPGIGKAFIFWFNFYRRDSLTLALYVLDKYGQFRRWKSVTLPLPADHFVDSHRAPMIKFKSHIITSHRICTLYSYDEEKREAQMGCVIIGFASFDKEWSMFTMRRWMGIDTGCGPADYPLRILYAPPPEKDKAIRF